MRLLSFSAAFVVASSLGVHAQTAVSGHADGRITGTVLGQAGQPIAGAYVMAVESLHQSLDNPPSAKSDSTGEFQISGLPLHNYHVYASKPQEGYPDADPAYDEENQSAIALSPDQPSASIVISIRKAGIVRLDVTDKATGKSVRGRYKLSVPRRWETQGEILNPLLIHPSTDVILEVSAKGYKTWFYSDASNASQPLPLRLASGEQKFLKVELEPEERNGTP